MSSYAKPWQLPKRKYKKRASRKDASFNRLQTVNQNSSHDMLKSLRNAPKIETLELPLEGQSSQESVISVTPMRPTNTLELNEYPGVSGLDDTLKLKINDF